jgi:sterol desaturase/sphingolipid hydroxylase (fatty acid hydroxylase superfamily)
VPCRLLRRWFTSLFSVCLLLAFWNGFFITVMGHCGYDISTTHFLDSILMVINPMIIGYMGSPVRATPRDHELHHTYPR